MINNIIFKTLIESPVRAFTGRVEIYNGSTLALICGCHDALKSFTVERVGDESKFFGYGICQKINVKLIDIDRSIDVSTANNIEVVFGNGNNYFYACPTFKVSEVHRDENTNELSITAYDALYPATEHFVNELEITGAYTLKELAESCAALLGLPLNTVDDAFELYYDGGANLDGTETIREVLDAIAEATQTIYYIDREWRLTFKRLDRDGTPVLTIDREKYITLKSGDNRRLATIASITELGDNVSASLSVSGSTQYLRDNPFLDMRQDIAAIIDAALERIGGLTINQFECNWRGNFLLELGDKIELITKDGDSVNSFVLNDTLTFDGSLSQKTLWNYNNNATETATNPTNIGDALKQTYARVDKANKQIEILASDNDVNKSQIANLQMDTESITATVKDIQTNTANTITDINNSISTLTASVEAKMSAEDVVLSIQQELSNGVEKVITATGFTFDDSGLTVSKSGTEMTTQITEDGMTVYRDEEAVLVANNVGVEAINLNASTYLIIGQNSRFEDYGDSRTGCFWIGG